MDDLLDIAPSTALEVVEVGGKKIEMRGLSFDEIAYFVATYPDLRMLLNGGDYNDVLPKLFSGCGQAIGPIIAAGCGHFRDEKYAMFACRQLNQRDQLKLAGTVFRLTFPEGIGPFVAALASAIGGKVVEDDGAKPMVPPKGLRIRSKKPQELSSPSADDTVSPSTLQ